MEQSISKKITLVATTIVFSSTLLLASVNYYSSYQETLKSARIELTGCANITTGILSAAAIEELVSGNQANLSKVEQELEWTIDHKKVFSTEYILSLDGKLLASDEHLKKQGFEVGTQFNLEQEIIDQLKQGEVVATKVYKVSNLKKITGYAPIFKDHDPNNEVIAVNAIDFEGSIVGQRTWESNKVTLFISLLLPFLAAWITSLVTKNMLRPIKKNSEHVEELTQGNLTLSELPVISNDELGRLSTQFNTMVLSLRNLVQDLQLTFIEISENAHEVHTGAENVQENAMTVMDSIEKVAEHIEQQVYETDIASADLK